MLWLLRRSKDCLANFIPMIQQIVVGYPHNAQASLPEQGTSLRIHLALADMRFSVELYDKLGLLAEKVYDERTDGLLSSEFEAAKPAGSQHAPQDALGDGAGVTELPRARLHVL